MSFTPEQRAKAQATRKANAEARKGLSKVVSIKDVSSADQAKMQKQIDDLTAQLAASEAARSDAEKVALIAAESQGALMQREIQEVPTGKSIKMKKLKEYKFSTTEEGKEVRKPVFHMVDVETYYYKIDMAPVGGIHLRINGAEYYHGAVYELDLDTLRTVKDIVFRTWKHERDIHASDENLYRKLDPSWQQRNAQMLGRR